VRLRALTAVLLAGGVAFAGCGSAAPRGPNAESGGGKPDLIVSAAASLRTAFTEYGNQFPEAHARFSFAGSDMLAAQIQRGVRPDVYASANTQLPQILHAEGLVAKPVVFVANRLVLAVPAGSTRVHGLKDLEAKGVTIAIGSRTVPIGAYTRKALARLGHAQSAKILANVRSEEPDAGGIVGKLSQKAVDAGFTYATDVTAARGTLRAIALPRSLEPVVAYAAAVVNGAKHAALARRFISGLLAGTGRADLLRAGFLPPPAAK
jgi:molybdate transport system substrate-binding protein